MLIKTFVLGPMESNAYILADEGTRSYADYVGLCSLEASSWNL